MMKGVDIMPDSPTNTASLEKLRLKKRAKLKNTGNILLFLLPPLLVYGLYNVYGIIRTFYFSTMKWTGLSDRMTFVGLENHLRAIQDPKLWLALVNNLKLVAASVLVQITLGLVLALIVNSTLRGTKMLRTVYYMPMLLSTVATGILWMQMYDPYYGLVNYLLGAVGLENWQHAWLGLPQTSLYAVLFVICWQYTPQYMILIRAGMTNISDDIYEAATIDGANKIQQFWRITFPLVMPTIKTAAVLSLVGSLKYFDLIYVMTGGGPNGSSELMATYMYKKGFAEANMGYASAIAVFMFMVSLILVASFLATTRKREAK